MASSKDPAPRRDSSGDPRILVSGPIGSGKSTVGRLLAERGVVVIEADRIGHEILEPDGDAFDAVAARWPSVVTDDRIDRAALARVVFADPDQLEELEHLTHPHIGRRIRRRAAATPGIVAVEVPLTTDIAGDGWHRLVVMADEDLRARRAEDRGMSPEDVRRRIAAQPAADEWLAAADSVIVNDGDLDTLRHRVDEWWDRTIAGADDPRGV